MKLKRKASYDQDLNLSSKPSLTQNRAANGRRQFLRVALLGGGATLLGGGSTTKSGAAKQCEVLLLSCMDFRLIDAIGHYMAYRGLRDDYDQINLAGGSLGALTKWERTFWEHLDMASKFHNISKVIVIDHRDCGAYDTLVENGLASNQARETDAHARELRKLRGQIKARRPALDVELLLMSLDGTVAPIS